MTEAEKIAVREALQRAEAYYQARLQAGAESRRARIDYVVMFLNSLPASSSMHTALWAETISTTPRTWNQMRAAIIGDIAESKP